ncbi:sigma-54-dependent Fis family transcriptional regulator [bacterium]|nr:sigma-54-dependent Fis family transcriptional regulator [candidate division CSSED10-310 bacterium]
MMESRLSILLVDDESNMRRIIEATLLREGYRVIPAEDGATALAILQRQPVQIIITDLKMPGIDGMTLLRECNQNYPDIPVIMLTAHGTVETAVEAMKIGAFDFISKPFDIAEIRYSLQKASARYNKNRLSYRGDGLMSPVSDPNTGDPLVQSRGIVAVSRQMKDILELVERVADSPSTVLITGESGTGKELVAGLIHEKSCRKTYPFIKVNCAAIPETLMESEFFGHERGAFTGAVTAKPGRFELADKGTLLLDEISEVSPEIQVKLLRAIQEREFERVGGIRTIQVDVRLIAASNLDLRREVDESRFRQDLYYRLNVIPIHLPALRERTEDIPFLVRFFIHRMNQRLKKVIDSISDEAMTMLIHYPWYGNIRELENIIERAVLLCQTSRLEKSDFNLVHPLLSHRPDSKTVGDVSQMISIKEFMQKQTDPLEKDLILDALVRTRGNVTRTAKLIGMSRKGLQIKLRKHGIDPRKLRGSPEFPLT